jgi:hypothetical protein
MDANGNALWTQSSSCSSGMSPGPIVLSDSVVAVTMGYGAQFKWNSSSQVFYSTSQTTGINLYLTRFNRFTGNYIHTDTLAGTTAGDEYGLALAADKYANFYIGGRMDNNIVINGYNMYSAGGVYDFFMVKFGNATCGPQSPVGLKAAPDEQSISVYPNPAASYVTIDHLPLNSEITLTDAPGHKVQTVLCMDEKQTLSTAHLRPGIYFIEVKHGNARMTRKIVIE